jgi:hypothetical protein
VGENSVRELLSISSAARISTTRSPSRTTTFDSEQCLDDAGQQWLGFLFVSPGKDTEVCGSKILKDPAGIAHCVKDDGRLWSICARALPARCSAVE